jgi:hypothetical protein
VQFFHRQILRPQTAGEGDRAQRPGDGAGRGAGDHLQTHAVVGHIRPAALLLPLVERLKQEIEHAGGVGAGRDGACQCQTDLKRVTRIFRHGQPPRQP